MFKLGKFQFTLIESGSEPNGDYLQYQICKENSGKADTVHEITVMINQETYELEPFFVYYANEFGFFRNDSDIDWEDDVWYHGKDNENWKFAIIKTDRLDKCRFDLRLNDSQALTMAKIVCTIRDNYEEYVRKMDREIVELHL